MSARESWPRRAHRIADRLNQRFGARLRRFPMLAAAWTAVLDAVVARQEDRRHMRRDILPAVARARPGRILFVGVRGYTRDYGRVFRGSRTEFWTCDVDPAAARFGAPSRHLTEDVQAIDSAFPEGYFDVVILNGVFGWGIDEPAGMDRTLRALAKILVPGGALLIGWNHDRAPDPQTLAGITLYQATSYAGLPARRRFREVTHVYAWYRTRREEDHAS